MTINNLDLFVSTTTKLKKYIQQNIKELDKLSKTPADNMILNYIAKSGGDIYYCDFTDAIYVIIQVFDERFEWSIDINTLKQYIQNHVRKNT